MPWREGAELFREMWPLIAAKVHPAEFRDEFVERLLAYFLDCGVAYNDLKGLHPEVDQALERLGDLEREVEAYEAKKRHRAEREANGDGER